MEECKAVARAKGLRNAFWSGFPGIPGRVREPDAELSGLYENPASRR
jgi:hypothetical protein